jgi:hypothetical protein
MSVFKTLSGIDVNQHVEKKGQFTYLSWAWAVAELRKASPTATWEVIKTDGLPFCKTECGYFVEVAVTVDGITLSQIHPVLDNNNKTIPVPNAFQINTSIQRCLVKAIALHGLGLYIYAGEDLPSVELESVDVYVAMIRSAKTMAELTSLYNAAAMQTKSNPSYLPIIKKAASEMKSIMENNHE